MTARSPEGDRTALERDVGPLVYRQLLDAFLELLPQQVAEMRAAAAAGDRSAAAGTARQIMDAAPAFGASRLAELAGELCSPDGPAAEAGLANLVDAIVRQLSVFRVPRRVLVADDDPVNQQVAATMVESLGFRADVVSDGDAAVRAARETDYHAILMDWHMPALDGAGAATEIRRGEIGSRHVPIIAMSASSLPDLERPFAGAQMDDYLRKPFTQLALIAALDRPASEGPVLDAKVIARLAQIGASAGEDLVRQLAGIFRAEAASRLEALQAGAEAADGDAIGRAAHALRGGAGSLGATDLNGLCAALEDSCERGDLLEVGSQLAAIEIEITRVGTALDALTSTVIRAVGP